MPYPRGMDFFDEDLVVPESEERPTQPFRFVVPDDDVPLVMEEMIALWSDSDSEEEGKVEEVVPDYDDGCILEDPVTWEDGYQDLRSWNEPSTLFEDGLVYRKHHHCQLYDFANSADPLFKDSPHSAKDFCRYMMAMKQSLGLGDHDFSVVVGTIISFLPQNNKIALCLEQSPSVYKVSQVVRIMAGFTSRLRTFQFNSCKKGCEILKIGQDFCSKCGECRWKHCTPECFSASGDCACVHLKTPVSKLYYMPIRDRIEALLKSDLKNFLLYDEFRKKNSQVSYD